MTSKSSAFRSIISVSLLSAVMRCGCPAGTTLHTAFSVTHGVALKTSCDQLTGATFCPDTSPELVLGKVQVVAYPRGIQHAAYAAACVWLSSWLCQAHQQLLQPGGQAAKEPSTSTHWPRQA